MRVIYSPKHTKDDDTANAAACPLGATTQDCYAWNVTTGTGEFHWDWVT